MNSSERDEYFNMAMEVTSADNLPSKERERGSADVQLSSLLNELGISLMPDSTVQDEEQVFLIKSCAEQPQFRVADTQPEIEEIPAAKDAAPKKASPKKRHRVVAKRKRHSKTSNSSSSSFSSSSSSYSPPSKTSTSIRSEHLYSQPSSSISESEGNVCRFHCKKCGQLRFLLVRGCLPERKCECGSTSVSVPTWNRAGQSITGGGLGRESFSCPRCFRIYSSGSQLLKHKCCKKTASTVENSLQALGVADMPKCPHCPESFIFDNLLAKHIKKMHKFAKK